MSSQEDAVSVPQFTDNPPEAQKRDKGMTAHIVSPRRGPYKDTINFADGFFIFHPHSIRVQAP